jgi:hypothetical protein
MKQCYNHKRVYNFLSNNKKLEYHPCIYISLLHTAAGGIYKKIFVFFVSLEFLVRNSLCGFLGFIVSYLILSAFQSSRVSRFPCIQ